MKITIEKNMRYCVKCQDEYLPEIETCGVCGEALILGQELLTRQVSERQAIDARKGSLTNNDDVVTIMKAAIGEVKRIEQKLVDANIGTLIIGDGPSCGKGCCGGGDVELLVRREDAQAALEIIESDFNQLTAVDSHSSAFADYGFDSSRTENSCPACGTSFSGSQTCPDCGLCFG